MEQQKFNKPYINMKKKLLAPSYHCGRPNPNTDSGAADSIINPNTKGTPKETIP
jgi:hypothetical protein